MIDRKESRLRRVVRRIGRWSAALALLPASGCAGGAAPAVREGPAPGERARPNIVWIVVDDMSANFGSYGETAVATPHVDRLADEGVRFAHAVATSPVCSVFRSALVTGMYQTSIGVHHHRSGRGELKIHLPEPVRLVPELLRDAGYQTLNVTREDFARSDAALRSDARVGLAKTDYNFEWDQGVYDRTHWRARAPGRPFFAQVQLHGGKLRGHGNTDQWPARARKTLGSNTTAESVALPPYLPDDAVIREDWTQYLDAVRYTDWEVGEIVRALEEAGELENTVVLFLTDHGISHVRNKQFLYEGGVHIPLIVRGPGIERGAVRGDVVEHIDVAAATLALAGLAVPGWMQARDILAPDYHPRRYAFSARDRMDETVDRIRSVRTTRYKYIRNFHPARPYLQPNAYKDGKPIVQVMRRLHAEGGLDRNQALIMAQARPVEELYDLQADPFELRNLAADPAHRTVLQEMRRALDRWMVETADQGPEPEAMYDSDMAVYLAERANSGRDDETRRNIELMKRWAAEGR